MSSVPGSRLSGRYRWVNVKGPGARVRRRPVSSETKDRGRLALLGGAPVFDAAPAPYPSIGPAEAEAVMAVVRSGSLSAFYGSPGDKYLGGPVVRAFEEAWSRRFGIEHTVSVN